MAERKLVLPAALPQAGRIRKAGETQLTRMPEVRRHSDNRADFPGKPDAEMFMAGAPVGTMRRPN